MPFSETPLVRFALAERGIPFSQINGGRLLDIGCNSGYHSNHAASKYGFSCVGIDVSRRHIEVSTFLAGLANVDAQFLLASAETFSRPGQFDVARHFGTLYHLPDPAQSLQSTFDNLRPGGCLALETQVYDRPEDPNICYFMHLQNNDPTNFWALGTSVLHKTLELCGFREMHEMHARSQSTDWLSTWLGFCSWRASRRRTNHRFGTARSTQRRGMRSMVPDNPASPSAAEGMGYLDTVPPVVLAARMLSLRLFWLLFLLLGAAQVSAQEKVPAFGMSFSFLTVDESQVSKCASVSRGVSIRNSVFITRYDQPEIRAQVRQALAEMRRSGFEALRMIVYFGSNAKSRDWFDVDDGHRAGELLKLYAEDAKQAGFAEFFLAFGVQGTSSPVCRGKKWGDCFDPASTARVNEFMTAVRTALGPTPPLRMRFDLALEMCAPPDLPEPLRSNLLQYAKSVITNYSGRFPKDETTMSCSLARFPKGRQTVDDSFAAAGVKPAFYTIHYYNRPDQDEEAMLRGVSADLKNSRIPIVIGETSYGDKGNLQVILQALVKTTGRVPAIYFWPLKDHPSQCHVDAAPPYTLEAAKGR
ncbi:MAG: class I SAM-dependent methyltransferase [Burkholderiaceae bacterium]|nr:class I SAM-dependent methyltransferase [Burkholderiaceae bacterium]